MKDNQDKRLLREIRLANLLSFGSKTETLPLECLNVLIGPNGAGKSNLIEALALMRATPISTQATSNADVRGVVRRGGGTREWIWKGARNQPASVELVVNYPNWQQPLRHIFAFGDDAQGFRLHEEHVENESPAAVSPSLFLLSLPGRISGHQNHRAGRAGLALHETDRKRLDIRLAMEPESGAFHTRATS